MPIFLFDDLDGMPKYSFDDIDNMFQKMGQALRAADLAVQGWQAGVKTGDYVFRRDYQGRPVFCEVLSYPDELPENFRHYRLTRSYSSLCPLGELRHLHVSTIEKVITTDEFREFKKRGWKT